MKRLIVILLIILCPIILSAEQDEIFQYRGNAGKGASFLNTDFNPYGVSTGGILTIFGDTADSVFWNPAGLSQIEDSQLQVSGAQLSYDRTIGYINFSTPFGEDDEKAMGFTVLGAVVNDIDSYDESDNFVERMNYNGSSFIFTFAKPVSIVKFGINAKVINELMDSKNAAWGGALDFGFLITPPLPISLGINIKNLPGFIKWDSERQTEVIGSGYQIGLGYKDLTDSMKFGLVFSKDQGDEEVHVNIGGEIVMASLIGLRFGYLKGNFGGGLGIDMGFANIDYAYYNERFLELNNSAHMLSTRFNF